MIDAQQAKELNELGIILMLSVCVPFFLMGIAIIVNALRR